MNKAKNFFWNVCQCVIVIFAIYDYSINAMKLNLMATFYDI